MMPIYEEMKKRLAKEKILHADETTLQVLREPDKSAQSKSYMWLYRTGKHAAQPMILYEYKPDRKAANAGKFLEGFSGWLHADGYAPILAVKGKDLASKLLPSNAPLSCHSLQQND